MNRRPSSLIVAVLGCAAAFVLVGTAEAAPKKPKKPAATEPKSDDGASTAAATEFDRSAAATAINDANLTKCKATNAARGEGHVTITFAAHGGAEAVKVDRGPWLGTPVAKCLVKEFKKAKVPAFRGEPVTVGKTFHFE